MTKIIIKTKKGTVSIVTEHRFSTHIDLKSFVRESISESVSKLNKL